LIAHTLATPIPVVLAMTIPEVIAWRGVAVKILQAKAG
jgi:hypothetical protein